jgi:integration host factor subunit beta
MTKSQLIDRIAQKAPHVPRREIEQIVNVVFDSMSGALLKEERIEIRGFGSFSIRTRPARQGRNPKTGERVSVPMRRTLSFIVGKELKDRINRSPDGSEPLVAAPAEPEFVPAEASEAAALASQATADPSSTRATLG